MNVINFPSKFKVGDDVEAFGLRGTVLEIQNVEISGVDTGKTFLRVGFLEPEKQVFFLPDGRLMDYHKEPSLKLINQPKRAVRKTLYVAVRNERSKYSPSRPAYEVSYAYENPEHAENQFLKAHQICSLVIDIEE